jgi:hypothetical protein
MDPICPLVNAQAAPLAFFNPSQNLTKEKNKNAVDLFQYH